MTRKKVADMTAAELVDYRAYMREAKRKSRAKKPPEPDNRKNRDRREYMREYYKRRKANNQLKSLD